MLSDFGDVVGIADVARVDHMIGIVSNATDQVAGNQGQPQQRGLAADARRDFKRMMRYHPRFNPRNQRSPTPRPDYAVMHQGTIRALLDAKCRDLWEKQLPRDLLYQLVVYAVSQRASPKSAIRFPTTSLATEKPGSRSEIRSRPRESGRLVYGPFTCPRCTNLLPRPDHRPLWSGNSSLGSWHLGERLVHERRTDHCK